MGEILASRWRVGKTKAQQRRITAVVSKKRSRGGAKAAKVRNPIWASKARAINIPLARSRPPKATMRRSSLWRGRRRRWPKAIPRLASMVKRVFI
jgi:hypothetical protein